MAMFNKIRVLAFKMKAAFCLAILILMSFFLYCTEAKAYPNPKVERYIDNILARITPYTIKIAGVEFLINDNKVYPPGKLITFFANYLLESNQLKDKVVAEVVESCFPLGIIAAKNGAKEAVGIETSAEALECARYNIIANKLHDKAYVFTGNRISTLLPHYRHKIDVLVADIPWEKILASTFENIPAARQTIARAFYDIDGKLITDILTNGPLLLAPGGKILITSADEVIEGIKEICAKHQMQYEIVASADLHNDGNIHYILSIVPQIKNKF
jgi:release factor glutamine methyltransferase